jgi:hypothetical protein
LAAEQLGAMGNCCALFFSAISLPHSLDESAAAPAAVPVWDVNHQQEQKQHSPAAKTGFRLNRD